MVLGSDRCGADYLACGLSLRGSGALHRSDDAEVVHLSVLRPRGGPPRCAHLSDFGDPVGIRPRRSAQT